MVMWRQIGDGKMTTRIYETRYYGPTNYRGARIKAQWLARRLVPEGDGFDEQWAEKPTWSDWDYGMVERNDNQHTATIRKAWPNAGRIRMGGETKQGYLWIVEEEEL